MRAGQLSDNTPDTAFQQRPLSVPAAICAEIAVRLVELAEVTEDKGKPVLLLKTLVQIADLEVTPTGIPVKDVPAFYLALEILCGDLGNLTKPFSETGRELGVTKQAVQQGRRRALDRMAKRFPEVSTIISNLHMHFTKKSAPVEDEDDDGLAKRLAAEPDDISEVGRRVAVVTEPEPAEHEEDNE